MQTTLRIATRTSILATRQTEIVKALIHEIAPELSLEIVGIKTQGDKIVDKSLAKIGGKGLFIKELQQALLDDRADIAVHSMKDVPNDEHVDELDIVAMLPRVDARDAFVSENYNGLSDLPQNAVIGTSSLRRQCQLLSLRPDLETKLLRGNIDTRIKKLQAGDYDAIILAAAGLERLNMQQHIRYYFSIDELLPAVGQGAIGMECRANDTNTKALLAQLDHPKTHSLVNAERAVSETLQGSCQTPIAAYAEMHGDILQLRARVGYPDGSKIYASYQEGAMENAINLGKQAARDLLAQGAQEILDNLV